MLNKLKQMLAASKRPRMGNSDEVKERWPNVDGTNPNNWVLQADFRANNPPDNYRHLTVYADTQYKGHPDAIVRLFYLEGSDHATWAIVTDSTDTNILIADDLGD